MSCTHSHHENELYYDSGNVIHVNFDLSGPNQRFAHIRIFVMICTMCMLKNHEYFDQTELNPCHAHIHIMVMICACVR